MGLKGIPFTAVPVNLLAREEKAPEFLARNPSGYVPCLEVDEGTGSAGMGGGVSNGMGAGKHFLAESLAIIEWLEEKFPSPALLPKDSYQRALARQLAETINSGTQPLINLDVGRKHSTDSAEQEKWNQYWIARGLGVYEEILGRTDAAGGGVTGKFSLGDEPTIADICLIPQCYGAIRFKVDLAQFPRCKKIYEYALSTPEGKAASADAHKPVGA